MGSGRAAASCISDLPACSDPVKPTAFTLGMLHQRRAHHRARTEDQRERPRRQAALLHAVRDHLPHHLAGARMRRMRLDDHRIARGKRRGRIPAGNRKRQRKIAGAEDCDRSERTQHGADIGARQRLAVRLRRIDARHGPRAFFHHLRKKPKLIDGAAHLSLQPRYRQRRLAMRALHNLRRDGFNARGNVAQEPRLFRAGELAVGREGIVGQPRRQVHVVYGGGVINRIEASSGGRVEALECRASSLVGFAVQN